MKTIINNFLKFVKKPNDEQFDLTTKGKLKLTSTLFLAELLATSILLPLIYAIDKVFPLKTDAYDPSFTLIFTFIAVVLIIPFIEELIFRYILRYKGIVSSLASREGWDKRFPIITYISAIAFGLVHIFNYTNSDLFFYLLAPIIISSQLIGGFIMAYIRVRINFIWGFYYHATWNLIFAIILPSVMFYIHPEVLKEETANYNIEIVEKPFYKNSDGLAIQLENVNNKIYKIESSQYTAQLLLDTLYGKKKYYVNDALIFIKFNSPNGISKDEFLKVLQKEYDIHKNTN